MYVDAVTLATSLGRLRGTASHLLKIWLVLKQMGLTEDGNPVVLDTGNSTPALNRLFSFADPDGRLYVPFAETPRFLTMKGDASRSIIQTNAQRWASSGSVVTCDPTGFLDFTRLPSGSIRVAAGRSYPLGLGQGMNGFAEDDAHRVSVPLIALAVWYGRQSDVASVDALISDMLDELHISVGERALVFVDDELEVHFQAEPLTNREIFEIIGEHLDGTIEASAEVEVESFIEHARRVRSMTSRLTEPRWLRVDPKAVLGQLISAGEPAILLYGPPRTGKTRMIDELVPRDDAARETIQLHEGWEYDYLVEGLRPNAEGVWAWEEGLLVSAVHAGKKFIVLEEINRTAFSRSVGEVFSLLEASYRGEKNGILLRSGKRFWIPADVTFVMTMNTVDRTTDEVDDALLGRIAAIECAPRPESLVALLTELGIPENVREQLTQLYADILAVYPLGHAYFAGLTTDPSSTDVIRYYQTRIRPVLQISLGELRYDDLRNIDNAVEQLFPE